MGPLLHLAPVTILAVTTQGNSQIIALIHGRSPTPGILMMSDIFQAQYLIFYSRKLWILFNPLISQQKSCPQFPLAGPPEANYHVGSYWNQPIPSPVSGCWSHCDLKTSYWGNCFRLFLASPFSRMILQLLVLCLKDIEFRALCRPRN